MDQVGGAEYVTPPEPPTTTTEPSSTYLEGPSPPQQPPYQYAPTSSPPAASPPPPPPPPEALPYCDYPPSPLSGAKTLPLGPPASYAAATSSGTRTGTGTAAAQRGVGGGSGRSVFVESGLLCGQPATFDWNTPFQETMECIRPNLRKIHSKSDDDLTFLPSFEDVGHVIDACEKLHNLSDNFVCMAELYGKVIIQEANIPPHEKSIPPIGIGGQAGGEKYIYKGILFKFANDWQNIYGSHHFAKKAAGHDLRSLIHWSDCPDVNVALMALIDYRGYRLVAQSLLPIGTNSLVYGSKDAGITVKNSDPKMDLIMQSAGTRLNLKLHSVKNSTIQMVGPIDIEGHLGHDGRYYVLDFARTFPPTLPLKRTEYLYKLMRPEWAMNFSQPLNSDVMSKFHAGSEEEKETDCANIELACEALLERRIPQFAHWLEAYYKQITHIEHRVIPLMHREGINCRYLGVVYTSIRTPYLKKMLLREAISRLARWLINDKFRSHNESQHNFTVDTISSVCAHTLNIIINKAGDYSSTFWNRFVPDNLCSWFHFPATLTEKSIKATLAPESLREFVYRILELTAIKLTHGANDMLTQHPEDFQFAVADIKRIGARTKHTNIVLTSKGLSLGIQAIKAGKSGNSNIAVRLMQEALTSYHAALEVHPGAETLLVEMGFLMCGYMDNIGLKWAADIYRVHIRTMVRLFNRSSVLPMLTLTEAVLNGGAGAHFGALLPALLKLHRSANGETFVSENARLQGLIFTIELLKCHVAMQCTTKVTQCSFLPQLFVNCPHCWSNPSYGVCAVCAITCHSTHEPAISKATLSPAFCDCQCHSS
ncbi:Histidine kinase [Pelomyxa schiedti]|nr:Histidine kinase [Pelomyxa schiedti]